MSDEGAIDYGPLTNLIGTWQGDKGMDIAPEPDGIEENPFFETITFDAGGDVENALSQKLALVRYHQVVSRKSTGLVFHDQVGYWMWDPREGVVMQSLAIPRGVCVLAGGRFDASKDAAVETRLSVAAKSGDRDWGVIESPFMRDNARTLGFRHDLTLAGDSLQYFEVTTLQIYGREFEHTDTNELHRLV